MHDDFINANPYMQEVEVNQKKLVTLDDFLSKELIPPVGLLKVDVEGFELEVVSEGKDYLRNSVKWILIEYSFVRSANSRHRITKCTPCCSI